MRKTLLGVLFLFGSLFAISGAYAGKVELTTYYPAPYGEYKDITASNKLKVPVKNVVAGTSPVVAGEIWVQDGSLPTAT